jgi:formylglycine-generating enzyme required for sulfatase activity
MGYDRHAVKEAARHSVSTRVVRGGAWNNNQDNARASNRNRNDPDNHNNNIGFRVCVSSTS